jgi:isopenicillin N synthase-like dioxygenase
MNSPALDHRRFTHGTAQEQAQYATELVQSLKDHSFVKIVNHGLEDATIEELFTRVGRFPFDVDFHEADKLSDATVLRASSGAAARGRACRIQ